MDTAPSSLRERQARTLITEIRDLAIAQYEAQVSLEDLKRERATCKAEILIDRSADDPKGLGANEALRTAAVERLYREEYSGDVADMHIAESEREIALRAVDIDFKRRLLRIEELCLAVDVGDS